MLMPVVDPDIVPPLVAHEYVEPLLAVRVRVAPGQSVVVPVIDAEQEQLITAGIFAFVKVLGRDARALVGHRYPSPTLMDSAAHRDRAALRGQADRVAQQVG